MDMVSPILDVASRLWNCTTGHAAYITGLEETLTSLKAKMEELKAISNDVRAMVQQKEQQGMMRTEQVQLWLIRVEQTDNEVNQMLQQNDQLTDDTSTCLKKCHCPSAYKMGKKAAKTLNVVTDLISSRGEFQEVAIQPIQVQLPLPAPTRETEGLLEMPMEDPVGIESDLQNVQDALKDDNVGIIGLYGMGGVGKTTLLKKINNELPRSGDDVFDVAFWVVASKSATVEAIQQDIMQKLNIPSENWKDKSRDEKSAKIKDTLKGTKYILMLDDLWERLDLLQVGFPKPDYQNKSKIVFTTRSEDICYRMKAHKKIKVTCLPWEKAWSLFKEHVGIENLSSHPEIMGLAQKVAKECDGLPLALITIGRAMSSRTTPSEWSHALQKLKEYPSDFPDFGKDVLPILKFSYDSLADSTIKQCFVYCSLFPEDYEIEKSKLVDLWMGEGYLKEYELEEACNHGYSIIEDLKRACLLESGIDSFGLLRVKMHDVIRDMALWIASDYGKRNNKFLILDEAQFRTRLKSSIQDWNEDVEKMSIWRKKWSDDFYSSGNSVFEMSKNSITCICPLLSTLIVDLFPCERSLEFRTFRFAPFLRVLDLSLISYSGPISLEDISKLENLEYLSLFGPNIKRLPNEFKSLRKLRYLRIHSLEELSTEIICSLIELVVFNVITTPYPENFLRGLNNLQKLQETSIYMNCIKSVEFFLKSEKLQKCARWMKLEYMDVNVLQLCPARFKNLDTLDIKMSNVKAIECNPTTIILSNLISVNIKRCDNMEELDFLFYAPSLKYLDVKYCKSLKRIMCVVDKYLDKCGGVAPASLFSSLKNLHLSDLASLEMICNKPLSFPSLEFIKIEGCPKLQQNPFNGMMPTKLKMIRGNKEWWNSLQWWDGGKQMLNHLWYD